MNFRSRLTAEGQEGPGSPTKIYENLWPVVPKSAISGHSSPPNALIGASNPLFPDQDQAKICLSNPLSPGQGSAGASRGLQFGYFWLAPALFCGHGCSGYTLKQKNSGAIALNQSNTSLSTMTAIGDGDASCSAIPPSSHQTSNPCLVIATTEWDLYPDTTTRIFTELIT